MAEKSDIEKVKRKPKFSTRIIRRCWRCGRNHGYMRFFNMCRICIREMAERGDIPGVRNRHGKKNFYMHTDPIADMLTRIRNAQTVRKNTVRIPFSRINGAILQLLKENGFIEEVKIDEFVSIEATLARGEGGRAKIRHIKRVSKPGKKIYVGKDETPKVLNDYGIAILSTHKGLMTNKEARKIGIGGEVICEVY